MAPVNRRAFLRTLAVGTIGAVAVAKLSLPTSEPTACDHKVGDSISIRVIQTWEAPSRLDVIYGWPQQPLFGCRVLS